MDNKKFYLNMLVTFLLALMLMLLAGCKTVYVPVPGESKTEYIYQEKVDTTIIKDSVYIKEIQKGDTVYLTEYRYKDRYKYIYSTDTLRCVDTIRVAYPVEVIKEVKKPLNWLQKLFMGIGICVIVSVIGYVAFNFFIRGK